MDVDDLYETLPTSSLTSHLMAGAAAGIMEHCVMYPVDSVKTRMQSISPSPHATYRNIFDALYKMMRFEGVWRPVRGINAVATGAGPAHALYFAAYERAKIVLGGARPSQNHLAHGMAGCLATLLHDAVMNPAEVVKQRMQMYNSPYKSCVQCAREIYRTEGSKAFYRSYITQLTMNLPFQSIHFMVYESMQETLNAERTYNPKTHVASGAVAGAVAAAITTPLDVCKTLLNTQERSALMHQNAINGMVQAIRTIYQFQGFSGYFRGARARVIYQIPSTAISWSVYEFFKHAITEKQRSDERYTPAGVAVAASAR